MPVIELSRGPVEYRRVDGTPGLAPVVFLHEGLGCVATWGRFPDHVAGATGRETVVYSRHGYGGSGPAPAPRTPRYLHEEAHDALPELLDGLGLRAPILVGHSEGASIALLYAARRPVTCLVAMAPHVFVEPETLTGIEDAVAAYRTGALRPRLARVHDDPDTTFTAWTGIWLSPGFRQWDISAELADVDVPLLLLQGELDQYGTLAQLDAVERAVRGRASRVELPGCGHSPHLERPAEVLDAVTGFLLAAASR